MHIKLWQKRVGLLSIKYKSTLKVTLLKSQAARQKYLQGLLMEKMLHRKQCPSVRAMHVNAKCCVMPVSHYIPS